MDYLITIYDGDEESSTHIVKNVDNPRDALLVLLMSFKANDIPVFDLYGDGPEKKEILFQELDSSAGIDGSLYISSED